MDQADLNPLVQRALSGDGAALDEVIAHYSPRVFSLLYRLTGSRDAAEDLLQETFLRMVRVFADYAHEGKFEAWLFRIAANLARDYRRRGKRRGTPASLDAADRDGERLAPDLADGNMRDPQRSLCDAESHGRLMAAFAELNESDREILALRHFGERPFREIADMLEIPLGTALARAHRALQRLRSALDEERE